MEAETLEKQYCVYILTNKSNSVLYTGVTGNLAERVYQHREKLVEGFTKRYNVTKLVYYEVFPTAFRAIEREKQIKAGSRKKKFELIKSVNPEMRDLVEAIQS